ncbi:GLUG motif-containing protein [Anaerotignum sp.]
MRKGIRRGIAFLMMTALLCSGVPTAAFAAGTVTISSKEDFLRFAKNCMLDSWSAGKTVELTCDIDLKHTGLSSVPIFSGTFDGQGHTISGVNLQQDGSNVGLFRYIEENGVVKNLRVEGEISPGGSRANVGGIAGENRGTIENCTFDGTVEGKTNVGGIAGKNIDSGEIQNCTVSGKISGELAVGGIVGENKGFLTQCENHAAVNTEYEEKQQEMTNLDTDAAAFLENYKMNQEETERNTLGYTDIGGVVGVTDGIVQGCSNYGEVGYPHTGYNVGGIAGRQSGYLLGCENYGFIYGRKDIGGIVGQAEPYLWLTASGDTLEEVRNELDTLRKMADKLLDDTDALGNDAEVYLNGISDHSEAARGHAQDVKDQMTDFVDENMDEINAWTALLSDAMDDLENPLEDLEDGLDTLGEAMEDGADALSVLKKDAPEIEELEQIADEIESIRQAKQKIQKAKTTIRTAKKNIASAILAKDKETVKQEISNIVSQLENIKAAKIEILASLKEIHTLMQTLPESMKDAGETVNRRWKKALTRLENALEDLSDAGDDISDAMGEIGDILSDLADEEPLTFVKLGDDFEESSDALFDSMGDISDDMEGLKNALKKGKDAVKTDMRQISDQFQKIMDLLFDEIEELRNGEEQDDIFIDASDEEISRTKQGKIANSRNFGAVEGDRNAGGIAGAMSIDLAADPEDDIQKPDSIHFTYRMKVILQNCINEGNVLGKKDCIGGVAGYAEIGTIYQCENYGDAESTGGDHVGGIAGISEGTIRSCYAKGKMTGGRYVGGIAGKADAVFDTCAIATISGEENTGVILGGGEDLDTIRRNYFVEQELGAVDGISYEGKAEPLSYEAMKSISGIPKRFISFTVTFLADGEPIETQDIPYGKETAKIKLPAVPEKKGYFGKWQPFETETVTGDLEVECAYQPYLTTVSSTEKNESGKLSLALAEGEFTDAAELHVFENKEETPPKEAVGRREVYDILLEDTDLDTSHTVTLRLLNEEKEKVSAWQKKGDAWVELAVQERGKYVVCEMEGTEGILCLCYTGAAKRMILLLPVALLLGGAGAVIWKKRRKKKKEEHFEQHM